MQHNKRDSVGTNFFSTAMDETIKAALRCVRVNGLYRHYKRAGLYRVLGVALGETDGKPVVIYREEATQVTWTRPLAEFVARVVHTRLFGCSDVEIKEVVDRFWIVRRAEDWVPMNPRTWVE